MVAFAPIMQVTSLTPPANQTDAAAWAFPVAANAEQAALAGERTVDPAASSMDYQDRRRTFAQRRPPRFQGAQR